VSVDKLSVGNSWLRSLPLLVGEPPTWRTDSGCSLALGADYSSHSDVVVNARVFLRYRQDPRLAGSRRGSRPTRLVSADGQLGGFSSQRRHRRRYAGLSVVGVIMSFPGDRACDEELAA